MTSARERFTSVYPATQEMKALVRNPVAYHYRHSDGLRCTMMLERALAGLQLRSRDRGTIEALLHPSLCVARVGRRYAGKLLQSDGALYRANDVNRKRAVPGPNGH